MDLTGSQVEQDLLWMARALPLMGHWEDFPQFSEGQWASMRMDGIRGLEKWRSLSDVERGEIFSYEGWRVGPYFESIVELWLHLLDGWDVLATNLTVFKERQTLGAFDLIVRGPDGEIEHWELAIKFYLGVSNIGDWNDWLGPNQRDRLQKKMNRMMHHQLPLSSRPEGVEALRLAGIPPIQQKRALVLGAFFTEWETGDGAPEGAFQKAQGRWVERGSLPQLLAGHSGSRWFKRVKPNWLGDIHGEEGISRDDVLLASESDRRPEMWSQLEPKEGTGVWTEIQRWFFVPDGWKEKGRFQAEKN
jgi:hypothetical protein